MFLAHVAVAGGLQGGLRRAVLYFTQFYRDPGFFQLVAPTFYRFLQLAVVSWWLGKRVRPEWPAHHLCSHSIGQESEATLNYKGLASV